MPSVCVLILNYQTHADTISYVKNLQSQQDVQLSILIVDNCSLNNSFSILSKAYKAVPNITVIQSEYNGGYAYGNNYGLRYLKEKPIDFIVISNNDLYLENPYLLSELIKTYQALPDLAFLSPQMILNGDENSKHQAWKLPTIQQSLFESLRILYWLTDHLEKTNRYHFSPNDQGIHPVDCLTGSFFMGAKTTFYQIGLFDENTFLYMEEAILGQKVKQKGLQNYLVRSLSFRHDQTEQSRSLGALIRMRRYWLASVLYYHQTYHRLRIFTKGLFYFLTLLWVVESACFHLFSRLNILKK